MLQDYLKKIADTTAQGDAREESYYLHVSSFKVVTSLTLIIEIPRKQDMLFKQVELIKIKS